MSIYTYTATTTTITNNCYAEETMWIVYLNKHTSVTETDELKQNKLIRFESRITASKIHLNFELFNCKWIMQIYNGILSLCLFSMAMLLLLWSLVVISHQMIELCQIIALKYIVSFCLFASSSTLLRCKINATIHEL